jgi:hypothetical protein
MDTLALAYRVACRYLEADERFRPPRHILQGVDSGELDPKVLLVWKYVVEHLVERQKFNYGAGVAYWRNKCGKEGLDLPAAYQTTGAGATFGAFKIKSGDEIEDWVKARLASAGLVNDTQRSAAEWQLEIEHLQRTVTDAQERIQKHEDGLAKGTRVEQRKKWLTEARNDLDASTKALEKARAAVESLQTTIEKHEEVVAPVIDFEKQFQLLLHQASNDLAKRDVLTKAKMALAKFEQEMANPRLASDKQAFDLWETVKRTWERLWDAVKKAFSVIADWAADLTADTKQIKKLLASV